MKFKYRQTLICIAAVLYCWSNDGDAAELIDVTFPGDPIVSTSNNGVGVYDPFNAIDNDLATKYLNFEQLNTGFTVWPRIGLTIVRGVTLASANDAPDRDPTSYALEGSYDGLNFTLISSGPVADFPMRFHQQTLLFENEFPYLSYRLIFPTINGSTCCMQIGEVELLGKRGPRDVTSPGDWISAIGTNRPASNGVANLIDDQPTKYDAELGSAGLVVRPSAGATVVTGLALTSTYDSPERDPASYVLEGSNDGTNFVSISTGSVPPFRYRYASNWDFFPDNTNAYSFYRLTFPTANGSTCCVSVAEVELLGRGPGIEPCPQTQGELIQEQPEDASVWLGARAVFQVKLADWLRVQWYRDGQPIPGATDMTYVTPPTMAHDDGARFHVQVEGESCERSAEVTLHVLTPLLSIRRHGDALEISWPVEAMGLVLHGSHDLTQPTWLPVSGVVSNRVTLGNPAETTFFRLTAP